MLFGSELLVICLRIVTIWCDCRERYSLKNLKVKMIQVKTPAFINQVGFLWTPVHIDLAPRCLEDNLSTLPDATASQFTGIPEIWRTVFPPERFDFATVLFLLQNVILMDGWTDRQSDS